MPDYLAYEDSARRRRCLSRQSCWALNRLVSADEKACVAGCADGFVTGRNAEKRAVCVCPGEMLYDTAAGTCVSPQECVGYRYALDGDFLQCLGVEACVAKGCYAFTHQGV